MDWQTLYIYNGYKHYYNISVLLEQAIGSAEASTIEVIGKAEAERMRQKAAAYKQYGDAALVSLVLDALPKVIY